MKKFLVIQTAFLGDVILATPLAANLKKKFPESEVHFLVKKGNESLLENHDYIDRVWTFDKSNGKYKQIFALAKSFRAQHFDVIFNLHRFASSGLIAVLSKGEKIYGFKKNPFSFLYTKAYAHQIGNGEHEVDRNLSVLSELEISDKLRRPSLFPSQNDFKKIEVYRSASYYCCAPASVWATKQLPKEKWVELLHLLAPKGQIFLLGSPSDRHLCQEIINQSGEKAINLAGELSLLQSAALMKYAQRNFVNDSGPLHLASAVNAPVTAFFCSTIPDFGFGPLSEDSEILETSEQLSCRPCGLHGYKKCPQNHFRCGNMEISSLKDFK